jgi:hypothetical protein
MDTTARRPTSKDMHHVDKNERSRKRVTPLRAARPTLGVGQPSGGRVDDVTEGRAAVEGSGGGGTEFGVGEGCRLGCDGGHHRW